jgi:hypothetical protein
MSDTAETIGMVFDVVRDVVDGANDVFNTMDTVKDICDGTCVVLGAVSAIPGAAAITGPVIGIYNGIRPTLVVVIDVGGTVIEVLNIAVNVMDALDNLLEGDFEGFASEASSLAQKAFSDN